MLAKTIKAKYKNGIIEPLEKLNLPDSREIAITITIEDIPSDIPIDIERAKSARGGWKGIVDCDELLRNIYRDRLINTRPGVKL